MNNENNTPQAQMVGISPDQKRAIYDRIRSAYDRGYNDARNAKSVPGDSAAGYRGQDKEAEIGDELLSDLRRLTPKAHVMGMDEEDRTPVPEGFDAALWQKADEVHHAMALVADDTECVKIIYAAISAREGSE